MHVTTHRPFWLLAWVALLGPGTAALAADPLAGSADATPLASAEEVRALAARIDKYLAAGWTAAGVEPAPPADDAEFLRRVSLDLAGRIPSVAEARAFLKDTAPDKRLRLVERLLASPRYVTHGVNVWRALLLPETSASLQARRLAPGFETWLREQLAKNAGYDAMIGELLTAPIAPNSPQFAFAGGQAGNPLAYFLAKEARPENLAAATARVFLGIRLECAQCHDHPFAEWKRDQFWSLAAFYSGIQTQGQGGFAFPTRELIDRREMTIPGTERVVQAKFPDGTAPAWEVRVSARRTLANWVTSPENPYFARATVNRMWYQLFGRGLVEPVDDMVGAESSASHPELLDDLASAFAVQRFDLKFLIRAITASRAYQLTSARTHPGQDDQRLFARMPLRGLTAEQLLDSLVQATGHRDTAPGDQRNSGGPNPGRDELLSKFTEQNDPPTEFQTTILQALALMNGGLIADQTALERSEFLAAIVDAPFLDTPGRIETLYLATLSRTPKPKELERAIRFLENSAGEDRETARMQALADVFWSLLNSGEFLLNH
jgi:hypothetical protein